MESVLKIAEARRLYFFLAEAVNCRPWNNNALLDAASALKFGDEFESLSVEQQKARTALVFKDENNKAKVMLNPADVLDSTDIYDRQITVDFDIFVALDLALASRANPTLTTQAICKEFKVNLPPDTIFTGQQFVDLLKSAAVDGNYGKFIAFG